MATPLLTRQIQVLAETETVSGTAETLVAADLVGRISEATVSNPTQPMTPREVARSSLTPLAALPAEKSIEFSIRAEINTPDLITTGLEYIDLFKSCGSSLSICKRQAIGSVTSGPYQMGETITDATGYQGICIAPVADGDGYMYYDLVTVELSQSEVYTGSTSGATATATADAEEAWGYTCTPISDSQETVTIRRENDGWQETGKGGMGTFTITAEASKPGYIEFTMSAVKHSYGDQAMTSGVEYDTEAPPILQDAELMIGTASVVFNSVSFDAGNNVVPRPDGNAANGLITYYISGRESKMTINMEQTLAADLDVYSIWENGTTREVKFRIGDTSGKMIYINGRYAQINNITKADTDGRATVDVEFMLVGSANGANDEWRISFI